jgi:hypothetical protein
VAPTDDLIDSASIRMTAGTRAELGGSDLNNFI